MKKYQIVIMVVVFLIVSGCVVLFMVKENDDSDALKFKQEYEELNNTIRESDGQKYNNVSVAKKNPIKYINTTEALEVLDSKQAIIYVGAPWCPWCRNAVPVLFEVAAKYDVDTIYYLDLDEEKDTFEIKDGKLEKTVEGTNDYYKLLKKLDSYLNDYKITDEDGNVYDTKEKRIYMPYVIGIKNGKVISDHVGTVDLNEKQTKYDVLTKKQRQKLFDIYEEMFEHVYKSSNNTCDKGVVCD